MHSTSTVHSQISLLLKSLLPKLERTLHKGQNGKVGIVGGSKDYTGAPFYAATASLKSGADIAHIFCSQEASTPIKCYSPDIIAHPCLNDMKELNFWLNAMTSIVIGPGLGRED
jgi:ATP-dependent NAD(P)H-hydrate dehydratase